MKCPNEEPNVFVEGKYSGLWVKAISGLYYKYFQGPML
jgi:hypothetical protein